jgi:hypothetical protein
MKTNDTLRDQVVLLLTNGMTVEAAEGYAAKTGALDPDSARRIVAEARKRITVAADYARDEQLGRAIMRLDDLYAKSIAARDTRTALQAQRELNRLLGLYTAEPAAANVGDGEDDPGGAARELALIDSYLRPLGLVNDGYPTAELARVAADILRERK